MATRKPDLDHINRLLGKFADKEYYARPADQRSMTGSSLGWLRRTAPAAEAEQPEETEGEKRIRKFLSNDRST